MSKVDNIPGLTGYYISRRGHLYSRFEKSGLLTPRWDNKTGYRPKKWRKLTPNHSQKGYLFKQIVINGKSKAFYLHRLVALVYLPPVGNSDILEVDHIDNDVKNNRVENLRWVTPKENVRHIFESGNRKNLKMLPSIISELERQYKSGVSIAELTRKFQVGRTTVRKILKHQRVFQNYK